MKTRPLLYSIGIIILVIISLLFNGMYVFLSVYGIITFILTVYHTESELLNLEKCFGSNLDHTYFKSELKTITRNHTFLLLSPFIIIFVTILAFLFLLTYIVEHFKIR